MPLPEKGKPTTSGPKAEPYVHQEYPRVVYRYGHHKTVYSDAEHSGALNAGWSNDPLVATDAQPEAEPEAVKQAEPEAAAKANPLVATDAQPEVEPEAAAKAEPDSGEKSAA